MRSNQFTCTVSEGGISHVAVTSGRRAATGTPRDDPDATGLTEPPNKNGDASDEYAADIAQKRNPTGHSFPFQYPSLFVAHIGRCLDTDAAFA